MLKNIRVITQFFFQKLFLLFESTSESRFVLFGRVTFCSFVGTSGRKYKKLMLNGVKYVTLLILDSRK